MVGVAATHRQQLSTTVVHALHAYRTLALGSHPFFARPRLCCTTHVGNATALGATVQTHRHCSDAHPCALAGSRWRCVRAVAPLSLCAPGHGLESATPWTPLKLCGCPLRMWKRFPAGDSSERAPAAVVYERLAAERASWSNTDGDAGVGCGARGGGNSYNAI